METRLIILIAVFIAVNSTTVIGDEVNARITNDPVVGQAEDMRIGVHIGNQASRYSTNLYDNFIGNGDFEDDGSWTQFPVDDMWNNAVPGLAYEYDNSESYDGIQSLKVTVNSGAVGNGVGQWASNKEYQDGKEYVFSCYMKQSDMNNGNNAQLQVHFFDTGNNCPGGFEASEDFSVTDDWQKYEMTFTMDKDCKPSDPAQGGANSKRINLQSSGTLYIDRCTLYDKEHMTPWGINKEYMELLKDLRPITIRYGALDVNELNFEDEVGDIWGRTEDRAGIAEYLQLAKLIGSNPDYVLSAVFSDQDYENLMEFMFGPEDSTYGQIREQQGYPPWDFDRFYYELGNELMCRGTQMSSPGACEWPGADYAAWSTPRINLFKDNQYWDDSRDKMGFNVWYDSSKLIVPLLEIETANTNGGRADFIMPAKYFDGGGAFSIAAGGSRTDYSQTQLTSNSDLYYTFNFGAAELMKTYIDYFDEITLEKYGKELEFGIYEYGPTGYPDGKSTALFDLEKSLGFSVSWLDMSVAMKEKGAEAINLFYYQGSFDSYSWALVDAYPYEKKRPAYYLFAMYGKFIRGQILERTLDSPTFNPYGPGADQVDSYGCSRGGSNCQNSDWGLTNWRYPVDVPLVEVYPFKYNGRYSFLIINRDLHNEHQVSLDIDYTPSPNAAIHYVTGSNPTTTNEDVENVKIEHTEISDFADNYELNIRPFSAYVLVNYETGSNSCLDEDNDGYGDNGFENDCSSPLIDCVDFNEFIYPGNVNSYCDCEDSDGYFIGGFEVDDGIDHDCDGSADGSVTGPICGDRDCESGEDCNNCPQDCGACPTDCVHEADLPVCDGCIDSSELSDYIILWKAGSVEMNELMEVIGLWKEGC